MLLEPIGDNSEVGGVTEVAGIDRLYAVEPVVSITEPEPEPIDLGADLGAIFAVEVTWPDPEPTGSAVPPCRR